MRWLAIAVLLLGCKKQEQPAAEPLPTTPSTGHSVTKLKDPNEAPLGSGKSLSAIANAAGSGEDHVEPPTPTEKPAAGSGSDSAPSGSSVTSTSGSSVTSGSGSSAGSASTVPKVGGNGKPAYRDDSGHVRGPGGPIFMGRGPECTEKLNHCLRDGVYFAVGNIRPGALFRATPVFQFEGKWFTFREEPADYQFLFKTKVVDKASELVPGEPIIWFIQENSSKKWTDNEMDALTSSRWECGIIEEASTDKVRVKGWEHAVPIETARAVIEKKSS